MIYKNTMKFLKNFYRLNAKYLELIFFRDFVTLSPELQHSFIAAACAKIRNVEILQIILENFLPSLNSHAYLIFFNNILQNKFAVSLKDIILHKDFLKILETKLDFITNISGNVNEVVLTDFPKKLGEYLSCIKLSDEEFKELLKYECFRPALFEYVSSSDKLYIRFIRLFHAERNNMFRNIFKSKFHYSHYRTARFEKKYFSREKK